MSDCLTGDIRTQLNTTMDSVLRTAVSEIMKIFESSLHDHQMELAQKTEEIAQLKIKLQNTEVKLIESECGDDRGAEVTKTQMNGLQREPEDVPNVSAEASNVPEIDFEVPDDWCAPLGCETMTKQDNGECPSIRLRSLYIPLWHIPVKEEVVMPDIESHQPKKSVRRSRRGSLLKERHKDAQDRSSPVRDQGTQCQPVRNELKKLLQNIKHDFNVKTGRPTGLRRGGRNSNGKEQEHTLNRNRDKRKMSATKSKSAEEETVENESENAYFCQFCEKVFDTWVGRNVHIQSHKRCRGCGREFAFPCRVRSHERSCAKLKKLLAKEAQSTDPPKPQSCKERPVSPSKKRVIIRKESTPSSSTHSESSIHKGGSTKMHSCVHCNKNFLQLCKMKEHMRIHTGEKPFSCSMCTEKFRVKQSLRMHIKRRHKDHVKSSETNGDLAWTKPLEVIEDNGENLISPSKDTSQAVNHNKIQREGSAARKPSPRWQTMGTRRSNGFICLLCQKRTKSKYMLIKHFRTHTGERPLKNDLQSPPKLCSRGQLYGHKKRCLKPVIQCGKCEKKFRSQTRYDRHVSKTHRDWPSFCKVCGKGFLTQGRFRNHVERHK